MNKIFLGLILVFSTVQAFAFEYSCFSIDENEPYGINKIDLNINNNSAVLKFQKFDLSENYSVSEYFPTRSTPKRPMMKMSLVGTGNNSYGESALYEFFGDRELITGGYALRDGKIGGFIKVTGWGYSWANYICFSK